MRRIYSSWNRPQSLLLGIISVATLLRVAAAVYMGNAVQDLPGIFDQISYHHLALRVLDGHGFSFGESWWPATAANAPTAHWSYLYTLFLAAIYQLFGPLPLVARLIQAVITGILMPWLIYRLACQIFSAESVMGEVKSQFAHQAVNGVKVGLVAAAITAVYIYFAYYAAALVTESFYIVSILWSFDLALRIRRAATPKLSDWLLLSLALGLAVLLRQLFLLVVPFILLWLWWAARPKISQLILPLVVIFLMILPWTVRNYLAFDQFVLLNTNAGYAFFWGNHTIYGTRFVPILTPGMGSYQSLIPSDLRHLNEAALDSALLKLAFTNIWQDPGRYLLLSLSRIPHYFVFWPSSDSGSISNISRVASFGLFLPFMVYGLIYSFKFRSSSFADWLASPVFLLYSFIFLYTAIHVLTWTLIRYRLPVDAILVLFAALAIVDLGQRWFTAIDRL